MEAGNVWSVCVGEVSEGDEFALGCGGALEAVGPNDVNDLDPDPSF